MIQPPPTPSSRTQANETLDEVDTPNHRHRNVFVKSNGVVIAGLLQHEHLSLSVSTSYRWISDVIVVNHDSEDEGEWFLRKVSESGESADHILFRNDLGALEHGTYVVVKCDGTPLNAYHVSEKYQPRIFSGIGTPKTEAAKNFRRAVTQRDRRCLITGRSLYMRKDGSLKDINVAEVAHILPVHYEDQRSGGHQYVCGSADNGFTIEPTEHRCFDAYDMAIDVDDDYRIVYFASSIPNAHTDRRLHLPSTIPRFTPETDQFLREHFRQALLKWIKGDIIDYPLWSERAIQLREEEIYFEDSEWTTGEGKGVLEAYFALQLFGYQSTEAVWERRSNPKDFQDAGPFDFFAAAERASLRPNQEAKDRTESDLEIERANEHWKKPLKQENFAPVRMKPMIFDDSLQSD